MCRKSAFLVSVSFLLLKVLVSAAEATEPNLVGWWKFDEGSGGEVSDSVSDNDGTINGAAWVEGQNGFALRFDGEDDYVNLARNAVTTTEFTITAWANHYGRGGGDLANDHQNVIFQQRDDTGGNDHCAIIFGTENLDYFAFATIRSSIGSAQSLKCASRDYNLWHYYTMTVGSNEFVFYIDAVEVNRTLNEQSGDYVTSVDYVDIGRNRYVSADRGFFNGVIDDFRVYDRALSDGEVQDLYLDQLGSRAYWPDPCSEKTGLSSDVILRWYEGTNAVSHDLYLGTDFDVIYNANRLNGDIDGDGQVDWYDVFILNEQWLDKPEEPYADLDGDGDVNLVDFSVVADDWKGCADVVFKGNQESNSYDPCGLALSHTYYWRIDEVNGPNTWKGFIWKFKLKAPKKGPYLLYPGDNDKMTVLWQLTEDVNCTIQWGPNEWYSQGSANVSEYGDDHQYKYTITGLTPATKYYYKVNFAKDFCVGTFRSAPPDTATSVKFMVYGDTRTNPANHDIVNQAMVDIFKADPEYQSFAILTGDWVKPGEEEIGWTEQFFDPSHANMRYMQANLPINGCIGNHEWNGGASPPSLFDKYWPYPYVSGFYWSFDYGPVHISVVDQYDEPYYSGSAQLNWLENDLSTTTKEWKFIMLHEPGYSAGTNEDNFSVQAYIQPLCETYGVDIVLAGHNHYYARCDKNGVKHITTGGGGAPLYSCDPDYTHYVETCTEARHFCKIDIDGDELDLVAVEPDGTVIDSFTLTH